MNTWLNRGTTPGAAAVGWWSQAEGVRSNSTARNVKRWRAMQELRCRLPRVPVAFTPLLRFRDLGGETEATAVGKDHVGALPDQLHLVQRGVPEALVRHAERVDPNDPCRLAPRLSGGEG